MEKWRAIIDKVDNGFYVSFVTDPVDGEMVNTEKVFENDDEHPDGLRDGVLNMFGELLDYFGEQGSKHNKVRIKLCYQAETATDKEIEDLPTEYEVVK